MPLETITAEKECLWDVRETAAYLHLAVRTVYKFSSMRLIPHLKVRGKLLFEPRKISEWLDGYRVNAIP
jgi:hypothetical protein